MSDTAPGVAQPPMAGALPLVSVVMPAHNNASHIAAAIDSVLAQDYPCLEIIVVDDGSTDSTREVVAGYGDKLRLLCQENKGSAAARNLGVLSAHGKYVAFLDADDVWWRNKIRYQVEALARTGHKMAYSRFIWWPADAGGRHTAPEVEFAIADNPRRSSATVKTGWVYAELLLDCIVWTSTVIVEKAELDKSGLFDETLRKGQDYDLWLRLSWQVEMLGLETPTALYRIHPSSITYNVKEINYEYVIISRAVARWGEIGRDGASPKPGLVAARLARSSLGHGYAHLTKGNPRIAAESFLQSMKHSRPNARSLVYFLAARIKCLIQALHSRTGADK